MALMIGMPLASQAAYKEVAVKNGGAITGKVTFTGIRPSPVVFKVTKDEKVCGTADRKIDYVAVNKDALENVVVYLDKVEEGKAFPAVMNKTVIDQKGCAFRPFLQVMKSGNEIAAVSSDPVTHNIHTYEILGPDSRRTLFNVSQPEPGTVVKEVSLKRGNAIKVECDAHEFMHGFVFVASNPYFAVVNKDGSFTIDNVPPGEYTIKAWHGTLGDQQAKVTVAAGGKATVSFKFKGE